jgi:hypothetical protein
VPVSRHLAALVTVVVAVGSLAACSGTSHSAPGIALPPVPATVNVDMREYAFAAPAEVPRGRVTLLAHNVGTLPHRFTLFPLPEDFPPILEQLRGSQRRAASALAALPNYPPGTSGGVAVDLPPGRYAMVCFVIDPDGQNHASKGMAAEFRVK